MPGGAGGLGAAIAALLVQDGAIPVVGYRSNKGNALAFQQRLQDLYGGLVHLVEGDVADPEARQRYVEAALAVKGELYGVVALTGDPARVKGGELDGAALHASFTANFEAPVLLARAAAEEMVRRDTHGSIVLVSSMQGVFPFEGSLAYASPKAALVHAARILAKEYGGKADIRVNVVAPGATVVGMARASIDGGKYDPYVDRGVDPPLRPPRGRGPGGALPARARLVRDRPGDHGRRRAHAAARPPGVGPWTPRSSAASATRSSTGSPTTAPGPPRTP